MRVILITALFALLCTAALPAQTPAQWRADVRYLASTLRSVHPEPFHQTSAATFDAAVKSLETDIPRLSRDQIIARMLGIVALLRDAHTSLNPGITKSYPLRFYKYVDGIFVIGTRADDARYLGAEVLTINGRPANVVYDSVQHIVPGDNAFSRMEGVPRLLTQPAILDGLRLGDTLQLNLALKLRDGAQASWSLTPSSSPGAMQFETAASADLPYQNRDSSYWFARSGDVLYARINVVDNRLTAFSQGLLAALDSTTATRLVVDLRNNPGGNNALAKPVVAAIANSRFNKRGQLFVITGRRTYSAAMNFTSMLEDQTRAIFVGEAPGGSPQHYGDATGFTLPNSKFAFNVSTLRWSLGVQPMDVRLTMEPDIPAPPRHDDVVHGRDAALEAIRAYTPGSILSERLLAIRGEKGFDAAQQAYRDLPRSLPAPWNSDVQQLLAFAWGTVQGGSREDIFKAFRFVTDMYPAAHEAWFDSSRVYAFVRDWKEAARTLQNAASLRPQHDLTRRLLAAAQARL